MISAGKAPSTWMYNDLADGLLKQMDVLFRPMHVLSQPCLYEYGVCRYGFTATIVTWKSVLVYLHNLDWQWTVQISGVVIKSVVQCKVINSFLNNFLAWNVTCHHSMLNSVIKLQALVYDSLWRKVPESDARSVLSHVLWYDLKCQPHVQMKNKI